MRSQPEPHRLPNSPNPRSRRANGNASRNTYLWQDADWTRAEAARAESMPRGQRRPVRRRPLRAVGSADLR